MKNGFSEFYHFCKTQGYEEIPFLFIPNLTLGLCGIDKTIIQYVYKTISRYYQI